MVHDANLPLFASPSSYELLAAQLEMLDAPDALLNGAIAIASHRSDMADVIGVDATLQRYADAVRSPFAGRSRRRCSRIFTSFYLTSRDSTANSTITTTR